MIIQVEVPDKPEKCEWGRSKGYEGVPCEVAPDGLLWGDSWLCNKHLDVISRGWESMISCSVCKNMETYG